jgi:hypothetical protein
MLIFEDKRFRPEINVDQRHGLFSAYNQQVLGSTKTTLHFGGEKKILLQTVCN